MVSEEFAAIVEDAYDRLPGKIRKLLESLEIVVAVEEKNPDSAAYGVYVAGLRLVEIYETPCRANLDMPLADRVYRVLLHEIGHVLGFDHDRLKENDL